MRHSVLPTLPHQRELCFSRNSVSKSNGQMTTPTISSVCGGSCPSVTKNSVIWSTCFNLQVPGSSFAISWAQLPVAEPAAATEDQPVRLIVASTLGPRAKYAPFSVCFYPFAYSSNSSPFVNKAARWARNLQGIYHVQFCFYFAITTILRATALEGRQHLASLRFTHTVPVSC